MGETRESYNGIGILATFAFSLISVEIFRAIELMGIADYLIPPVFFIVFMVIPVITGLLCRNPIYAILVSVTASLSYFLVSFPLNGWVDIWFPIFIAVMWVGVFAVCISVFTYAFCRFLIHWRDYKDVTRQSVGVIAGTVCVVVLGSLVILNGQVLFDYFEGHPWVVALLSIVVTLTITVFREVRRR